MLTRWQGSRACSALSYPLYLVNLILPHSSCTWFSISISIYVAIRTNSGVDSQRQRSSAQLSLFYFVLGLYSIVPNILLPFDLVFVFVLISTLQIRTQGGVTWMARGDRGCQIVFLYLDIWVCICIFCICIFSFICNENKTQGGLAILDCICICV